MDGGGGDVSTIFPTHYKKYASGGLTSELSLQKNFANSATKKG